jgi:phage shock protein PspC (stress-responsive transcriptional regulator)
MNKTININLGGYAFIIDEDAFETANNYLSTLTRHFGGSESSAEIMHDIESRMGELISRSKGTRTIVSKTDVVDAIAVLGTPEELKDMDFAEPVKEKKAKIHDFRLKTGKRLYRDPDDKILGGVCSGLASYFGIQDAVWVRILFVLLALAGGASFVVYIVLWAIVPTAKTVSERLEMMGEPTNVNNIARMVKEEFEELSDKIQDKFSKKNKGFHGFRKHHQQHPPHDDKMDPTMKSGWSWDFRQHEKAKMDVPYQPKDFV